LAEYQQSYSAIQATGAELAALSVDGPEKSEAVRDKLGLAFPILCDTQRVVVRQWGVYNSREKGGIAKPAVFILEAGRIVRYVSVDGVASRVPASEIVLLLGSGNRILPTRRALVPGPGNFFSAVRNSLHFGVRQPKDKKE
jgi:peroxiredoxin